MARADYSVTDIQGVNLANYVRDQRSYNPIVYIHKKFVPTFRGDNDINERKTSDKCLQCKNEKSHNYKTKVMNHDNDPVVEQTIKFAKDIIPLTIPPSNDASTNPVYYTIKTKKNPKRKKNEGNFERSNDITYEKEKSKTVNIFLNADKAKTLQSYSAPESTSRSSQNNTLDDINENRSLCCSFSEPSDKKHLKRERFCNKRKQNDVPFVASESFEALAEHLNTSDDTKIKIHLMNERDKSLLCESIRMPVIKAIQDCILELHKTNDINVDLQHIQRNVQDNSEKLEYILDKLSSIERKFEAFNEKMSNKDKLKVSKLEELEQDVIMRETSSEEEVAQIHFAKKKRSNNVIVALSPKQKENETEDDRSIEIMDRGEGLGQFRQTAQVGVRTDRTGRIPARFCWTDATKQNLQRTD